MKLNLVLVILISYLPEICWPEMVKGCLLRHVLLIGYTCTVVMFCNIMFGCKEKKKEKLKSTFQQIYAPLMSTHLAYIYELPAPKILRCCKRRKSCKLVWYRFLQASWNVGVLKRKILTLQAKIICHVYDYWPVFPVTKYLVHELSPLIWIFFLLRIW